MGERRMIFVGLALTMAMGFFVYLKLWAMDYTNSSNEMDLVRQQFDLANKEAMDESAEWRLKYDQEVENSRRCQQELIEVKQSFGKRSNEDVHGFQKENALLLERLESLKQEIEVLKLQCKLHNR